MLSRARHGGTVFSRVAPEDKVRIVDLVKNSGRTVAVTGDGIDDAPALRHGIIGVAMGESGTDVAKQAAEIVLLDDSFSTPVGVAHQGRTIYRNIRRGVLSCVTFNAAEFVVNSASLALTSLFGAPAHSMCCKSRPSTLWERSSRSRPSGGIRRRKRRCASSA